MVAHTYFSVFHMLWTVSKYPQLAALCIDITGSSKPHNIVTTKYWIVPQQSNLSSISGWLRCSQKSVTQPCPVASLRCDDGCGRLEMKSDVHLPSCQVYSVLVSPIPNLPRLFCVQASLDFHNIMPCICPDIPIRTTFRRYSLGSPETQNCNAVMILSGSCSLARDPASLSIDACVSRDFVWITSPVSVDTNATFTVVVPKSMPRA